MAQTRLRTLTFAARYLTSFACTRVLQFVFLIFRLYARLRRGLQKPAHVGARHIGSRLDFLFHPQLRGIIQLHERILVNFLFADGVDHESAPGLDTFQRFTNRPPDRRGVNDGIQFFERTLLDAPRPGRSQRQGELTLCGAPAEHKDARVDEFMPREFQYQMIRPAEAHQAQRLTILQIAQAKRAITDRARA